MDLEKINKRINQEEKIRKRTELMLKGKEEIENITIHEAIHNYNQANLEYEKQLKIIDQNYQHDASVLKAVIMSNINIASEDIKLVGENYIELCFDTKIPYTVFEQLENTGLTYEVSLDDIMYLRIFLDPPE